MARHLHGPFALSILSAATDSAAYTVQSALGSINSMVVFSPATLPETINIQVAPTDNPQAADWKILQWQPGTDIVVGAGKAVNIPLTAGFRAMRIHAGVGVAAQRDFSVIIQVDTDESA